eukprot:814556-Pyramimonas_sp.AAC.1
MSQRGRGKAIQHRRGRCPASLSTAVKYTFGPVLNLRKSPRAPSSSGPRAQRARATMSPARGRRGEAQ